MRETSCRLASRLAVIAAIALSPMAMAAEPVLFQGSYYQYVPTGTTWDVARATAYSMSYEGLPGRLATITSAAEQSFVASLVNPEGYVMLGASDAAKEGTWVWETGPERGQVFWKDGAAVGGAYTNWRPGEPNNVQPGENYLVLYRGGWNDSAANAFIHAGFVVEYRGETHAFDFTMSNGQLGAIRNLSPTDHLVGLDIHLAADTVFNSAPNAQGHEYASWSVIAATPGASWTLPDNLATEGQQNVSMVLDLAPGQALHMQVDLDRLSLGDSQGIADGTEVTAWYTDGDVRYSVQGVVHAGQLTVLGTSFPYSVHSVAGVPEPATWLLWAGGLAWVVARRARSVAAVLPGSR